ncbi:MAG: hypothetical protein HAW62_04785 [Endozoicomonadaceae bacterium]|nr:hypothetical protein [Endozoicomonadaceae bacterium]
MKNKKTKTVCTCFNQLEKFYDIPHFLTTNEMLTLVELLLSKSQIDGFTGLFIVFQEGDIQMVKDILTFIQALKTKQSALKKTFDHIILFSYAIWV